MRVNTKNVPLNERTLLGELRCTLRLSPYRAAKLEYHEITLGS